MSFSGKNNTGVKTLSLNDRAWGSLIDALMLIIPVFILFIVFSAYFSTWKVEAEVSKSLAYGVAWELSALFYFGVFEARRGASVGLRKRGGIIAYEDGSKCDAMLLFKRYALINIGGLWELAYCLTGKDFIVSHVDFLTTTGGFLRILMLVNFFAIFFNKERRYLVDYVFRTRVLEEASLSISTTPVAPIAPIAPIAPRFNDAKGPSLNKNQTGRNNFPGTNKDLGNNSNESPADKRINDLYNQVLKEIQEGLIDQPLMARADVESNGNEAVKNRLYMKFRVSKKMESSQ